MHEVESANNVFKRIKIFDIEQLRNWLLHDVAFTFAVQFATF